MTVNHPVWGTICEICFKRLTVDDCVTDTGGQKWDICKGECARQAGIDERGECQWPNAASRSAATDNNK